jgi:preprotein translocase subunit SecE
MTEDMQSSPTRRQLRTGMVALAVFVACIGLLIFMLWPR